MNCHIPRAPAVDSALYVQPDSMRQISAISSGTPMERKYAFIRGSHSLYRANTFEV